MKPQSLLTFTIFTAVAAATAASAAHASLVLTLPVWAMFIGWVAFFTRGVNARDGLVNFGYVLLGITFGIVAALAIGALRPMLGAYSLPVVVFGVAMIVVSLRAVPVLNNILGYFLGLIAYFASHHEPSLMTLLVLGGSVALGSFAGWISHALQRQLAHA